MLDSRFMTSIRSFLRTTWQDLRALPLKLARDRDALAVMVLTLLPWCILILRNGSAVDLQQLGWLIGLIAFYWLVGRRHPHPPVDIRKPRLELVFAIGVILLWIIYRVGEYWRWFTIPSAPANACGGGVGNAIVPKMIEMVVLPIIFLLVMRYSLRKMGFSWDKSGWLAALVPVAFLIVQGLSRYALEKFAVSSACFFFAAGLPEEFVFRAFLQTRLEALLRNPLWALWLASFIFGLSHISIDLAGSFAHWQDAVLTAFTYQMTAGFALGYAYMLTRNLLPLSIVHTLMDSAI